MPILPHFQATAAPAAPGAPVQLGNPAEVYRALRSQREVLGDQRQDLENQRHDLQRQFDELSAANPARAGISNRIQNIDARLTDLDQQIQKSDLAVAQASGVPGATVRPPEVPRTHADPDMVVGMSFVVALAIVIPISIAYARRIWRRSAKTEVTLPPQMMDRMDALERGMEAIALEVERIGEGQRFVTQALSGRALGQGAAEPIPVREGERAEQRR